MAVWVVAGSAVVLSVLAFALLQSVEQRNVSLQAADAASTRTAALTEAIHDRLALVASARLIFDVSDEVTRPGFGLSMVFGFVMQSNGHITLTSAPGRGTTVRMYFPRAASS